MIGIYTLSPIQATFFIASRYNQRAWLVTQLVKKLPAMLESWVQSLDWEDPVEKGITTHSSIFAWRITWTEEAGRLYSPWGRKESDMTE